MKIELDILTKSEIKSPTDDYINIKWGV
jgi:hypothetical protein